MSLGGVIMAKSTRRPLSRDEQLKQALSSLDTNKFKHWLITYNKPLWKQFVEATPTVQKATMCKMICNRTDMLNTEAHKKAVEWLKKNNYMKGQMF